MESLVIKLTFNSLLGTNSSDFYLISFTRIPLPPVCWAPIQVVLVQKSFSQREWSHDYTKVVIQVPQQQSKQINIFCNFAILQRCQFETNIF